MSDRYLLAVLRSLLVERELTELPGPLSSSDLALCVVEDFYHASIRPGSVGVDSHSASVQRRYE